MTDKVTKLVNKFNSLFPVGTKVHWRSVGRDGVPYQIVTVQHPAYVSHGQPVVFFEERRGYCSIEENFVNYHILVATPLTEQTAGA